MSIFFTCNDTIYPSGAKIISADNYSFKYGVGLFETLKVEKEIIQLADYHFERLFSSMKTMQFAVAKNFNKEFLQNKIYELCKKNNHSQARVRLTVFKGDGGLYDLEEGVTNYIIQTWHLNYESELNSNGLILDIYPGAKKPCDTFSNIKNNNFLPYAMGAIYAKQIRVNDCIILNCFDRICDTTIANIFIIKNNIMYTPPLQEGCIDGVMRRFIIEKLFSAFNIIQQPLTIEEVKSADEVFLTNSIKGIRWVKQFLNAGYTNKIINELHQQYLKKIF